MPADVQYNQDLNLVEVVLTGKLSLGEMKKIRARVQAFSEELDLERILVNASRLEGLPGVGLLYEFAASFWAAGFSERARLGVIVSEATSRDFQFIENVAQNRAFAFRKFTSRQEAVDWLLE